MLFYKGGRGILLIKAKNAKAYKKTRILYAAPFWGSGAKSYMWYPISRFVLVRNLRSYFYQALIRTWIPFLWKFNEFLRQKTCIPWQQDIVATPTCHILIYQGFAGIRDNPLSRIHPLWRMMESRFLYGWAKEILLKSCGSSIVWLSEPSDGLQLYD